MVKAGIAMETKVRRDLMVKEALLKRISPDYLAIGHSAVKGAVADVIAELTPYYGEKNVKVSIKTACEAEGWPLPWAKKATTTSNTANRMGALELRVDTHDTLLKQICCKIGGID